MKSKRPTRHANLPCRSPYGERGLKWSEQEERNTAVTSLSLRRAWIEIRNGRNGRTNVTSLSLRRAWIEILILYSRSPATVCRSPYGERGLKSVTPACPSRSSRSLSLRRAWIEIVARRLLAIRFRGRSPYGERGLKYGGEQRGLACDGRSPYGERGLKYMGG